MAQLVRIPYDPFPLTNQIHKSQARYRILNCGRRIGKTLLAVIEAFARLKLVAESKPGYKPRAMIVAPSYEMVRESWLAAEQFLAEAILRQNLTEMRLDTLVGEIAFKSTESKGGAGRGGGFDVVVLDEASRIPPAAWEEDIRPAISDRHGVALFTSTPRGRNWFYQLFLKGQPSSSTYDPDYQSFQFSTLDGWRSRWRNEPEKLTLAEKEWDQIRAATSERTFRQEYMAEFLQGEGKFFRLDKALRGELRPAVSGRTYVAGLDPARAQDWMVTVILEVETKQLVALHRVQRRSWDTQKNRVIQLIRGYPGCQLTMDATGLGDPLVADFAKEGISVQAVRFNNTNKRQMVNNLDAALDHGYLGLPDSEETRWLLDELENYEENETAHGNFIYSAPPGLYDDGVTALMLAAWGMRHDLMYARDVVPEQDELAEVREAIEFTRRCEAYRAAYPGASVPTHPRALAWQSDSRWKRMYRNARRASRHQLGGIRQPMLGPMLGNLKPFRGNLKPFRAG